MYRSLDLTEDLKIDILELKKQLASSKAENQLLKVKIRKLENEISKREKQIKSFIDPNNSALLKKTISEKGTCIILNLKERNEKLEKLLSEKENIIKRLQNDLQTKNLYSVNKKVDRKINIKHSAKSQDTLIVPYLTDDSSDKEYRGKQFKSASTYEVNSNIEEIIPRRCILSARIRSASVNRHDIKHSSLPNIEKGQIGDNSSEIFNMDDLKSNQEFSSTSRKSDSPKSDLERIELQCDTAHRKIQQLRDCFLDMISDVDRIKNTISNLKVDHAKTKAILKEKNANITKLAEQIDHLRNAKPEPTEIVLKPTNFNSTSKKIYGNSIKPKSTIRTKGEYTTQKNKAGTNKKPNSSSSNEMQRENREIEVKLTKVQTINVQACVDKSNIEKINRTLMDGENKVQERKQNFYTLMEQLKPNDL